MAIKYLQCGKENTETDKEPDMDFDCDMNYIRSSFMSDYQIDLDNYPDMHWWKFCELLQGLTDSCVLNRVRDIRNYDISKITDAKTRFKMMQAKQNYALPDKVSQEELDIIDNFYAQFKD